MREIIFKGMDLQGEWHIGNISKIEKDINVGGIKIKAGYYISNSVGMPFAYHCRPETISQFTGICDSNGNKIFENHIVRILDRDWTDFEKDQENYKVVFKEDGFILEGFINDKFGELPQRRLYKEYGRDVFEIIGNSFENPNLIK